MRYYPCIAHPITGHIVVIVGRAKTHDQARNFLRRLYWSEWLNCDAIPQPTTHFLFIPPFRKWVAPPWNRRAAPLRHPSAHPAHQISHEQDAL